MTEYQQLSLFDLMEQPKPEKVISAKCASCVYRVWLHPKDGVTKQGCEHFDGCEYTKKNCYSCGLYGEVIDAYTCERLGYNTCFNNDAKFNYGITDVKPEDGCQFWTKY